MLKNALAKPCRQRGSVLVEFLAVFPAFLALSMFVLEVGFMWADRHVTRLAAFEAARVLASANLPEWDANGARFDDACAAPQARKRAKQAALRKIAIVSPPVSLFLVRLGAAATGLDLGPTHGEELVGPAKRLAERWPTAAISTELAACEHDRAKGTVRVALRYHRMLQTPFIDRIMFLLYEMIELNRNGVVDFDLDGNFMGVEASIVTPEALRQARAAMRDSLTRMKGLGLSLEEAARLLRDVPGIEQVLKNVPDAVVDVAAPVGATITSVDHALGAVTQRANATLSEQTTVLTSLVGAMPSALWRIPIEVTVSLQRDPFTSAAKGGPAPKEPRWNGLLRGSLDMSGGTDASQRFRTWGKAMSEQDGSLQSAAPLVGDEQEVAP